MNRQAVFLVCFLAVLAVSVNAEVEGGVRIVNGEPTTIDRVPYLVQLRTKSGSFFCGGSLVSATQVISAAHCLKSINYRDIVVVAGATYQSDVGAQRTIVAAYQPSSYDVNNPTSADDIVVFKLNSPMPFNKFIQPIGFCDKPLTANTLSQVSGWGAIYAGSITSQQVNTVRVPIVDLQQCKQLYSNFASIHGSMICAAALGSNKDSCQGDSGGPLVINDRLCGVVSWGRGCARSDSPGVYTSITYMADFLNQALGS